MDSTHFDRLVRSLGQPASRRGALGLLAGLAGVGLGEVAAKRKVERRGKDRGQMQAAKADKVRVCHFDAETHTYDLLSISRNGWENGHQKQHDQDFILTDNQDCCTSTDCGGDQTCCGGHCVDAQHDNDNCGTCGNACPFLATCTNGICQCPPFFALCADGCKDVLSDARNCGACGRVCPDGRCAHGLCEVGPPR